MKISTPRYTFCLLFQLTLLLCDLIFNCVSLFPRSRDGLLVLFIFQDLFLVVAITSMLMSFFSTYLFQAGLVAVLCRKFRGVCAASAAYAAASVCVCVQAGLVAVLCRKFRGVCAASAAYAAASVCLHAGWLLARDPHHHAPPTPLLIFLFTVHRCLSPWYYFVYKRAALRVSDPRLYDDADWAPRAR